jgi:predicted metal-dependent enzyme (double-stranded beta helix superfamily)
MEGTMTQSLPESRCDLAQFIADVRRLAAATSDDREKIARLRPLMRRVLADPSWLPPAYTRLDPNLRRPPLWTLK